eukprot:TRINITY_DN1116_c1_g1_i1.p1 TRINITY_DN1116_c1_g1~~TRINITY_DN1116_c1_g1_i1.p1  ORF type:complete len:475 (+),score=174.64 TRINITY_DN1116_c1_g1_i1:52-1476(+)
MANNNKSNKKKKKQIQKKKRKQSEKKNNSSSQKSSSSGIHLFLLFLIVLVGVAIGLWYNHITPSGPQEKPFIYRSLDKIWDEEELQVLQQMVKDYETIPSATKDQTSKLEHIGEAEPLVNGTCPNGLLIPNKSGDLCVLPTRVDIALHYLKTGGVSGLKVSYNGLISRMLSFNKFFFSQSSNLTLEIPGFSSLFESQNYLERTAEVCDLGTDEPYLDPFQLGIIVQIPGQQVPMHLDTPYFWGATRFEYPLWLLVCMQWSGLWEDERIHQVQGVAYLHDWPEDLDNGGSFFYYPDGPGGDVHHFQAHKNAAIILDGSIQVHGTSVFRPKDKDITFLSKDNENKLVYKGDNKWSVMVNDDEAKEYNTSDLRISLVWRERCFKSLEEKIEFDNHPRYTLDEIFKRFENDLRSKGILKPNQEVPKGIDLATLLLDSYVHYPLPNKWMPYNYCALPKLLPDNIGNPISSLLSPFCSQK